MDGNNTGREATQDEKKKDSEIDPVKETFQLIETLEKKIDKLQTVIHQLDIKTQQVAENAKAAEQDTKEIKEKLKKLAGQRSIPEFLDDLIKKMGEKVEEIKEEEKKK